MSADKDKVEQVEAEDYKNSELGEDPIDDTFNITVSIPETVQIKMVNASTLSDYEVWLFISSILSNAFLGFLVAYCTNSDPAKSQSFFYSTIIFTFLFVVSICVAFNKRQQLQSKSKDIKLKTSALKSKKK